MNSAVTQRGITLAEIRARKPEILRIAGRRGVKNIRVIGSVARAENTPTSDVDFLVEMEPPHALFDLSGFRLDMEELLGCEVDVVTPGAIDPRMKERIYADAKAL